MHHVDINNAFLYGHIEEEVCMQPPQGYSKAKEGQICKLKKILHTLKQASRAWNVELKNFLKTLGFKHTYSDYSLFTKKVDGKYILLLAYVDDLFIIGNVEVEISRVKQELHRQFTMKDLGHLRYFLGVE